MRQVIRSSQTKCKTSYGKAMVVALCALLLAVCLMAVGLSSPQAQTLASTQTLEINGGGGNLITQPHA